MEKMAAVFPVVPGKDARTVAAVLQGRDAEYAESRRAVGIHMERAFEQVTPAGTVVVAYGESDGPFLESDMQLAKSDLAIDRDFIAALQEVHGVDFSQPPRGEPPEVLADWVDESVPGRKSGLAFSVPVMPGATEIGRAFAKEAYETRRAELAERRRAQGLSRELVALNHTPMGDFICVYIEGDDPVASNRRFAESREAFDVWFKDECKRIFPPDIDFNQPLPPITMLFDSEDVLAAAR